MTLTHDFLLNIPADQIGGDPGKYVRIYIDHMGPSLWKLESICFEDTAALAYLTDPGQLYRTCFEAAERFVTNYYANQDSLLSALGAICQPKEMQP